MNKLFTKIATFVAGTALAVGVGIALGNEVREAKADEVTYQYLFNERISTASAGTQLEFTNVTWDVKSSSNFNTSGVNNNYKGIQIGSSSSNGAFTIETHDNWGEDSGSSSYLGKTKINKIYLYMNRGGDSMAATVSIGGTPAVSDGTVVAKNSTATSQLVGTTKVTYTPAAGADSGKVLIAYSSVKAGYICAIQIACEEGLEDQSISGNNSVYVGSDLQLTTNAESANWSITSGSEYAEFKNGVSTGKSVELTGVAPGNVTVKAEASGYKDATKTFEVQPSPTAPLIVAAPSSLSGFTGDVKAVTLEAYNVTIDETSITCSSGILELDNKSAAGFTVNMNSAGSANVVVKDNDSEYSINVPVTITQSEVTKVTLNKHNLALSPSESEQLTADVTYVGNVEPVEWSSNNTGVATVDNDGTVHAVAVGTAVITASTGGEEDSCTVTVSTKRVYVFGDSNTTATATDNISTVYGYNEFVNNNKVYCKTDESDKAFKMGSSSDDGEFTYTLDDSDYYITSVVIYAGVHNTDTPSLVVTPNGRSASSQPMSGNDYAAYTFDDFPAEDQIMSFVCSATERCYVSKIEVYTAAKVKLVQSIELTPSPVTLMDNNPSVMVHTSITPTDADDTTLRATIISDEDGIIDHLGATQFAGGTNFSIEGTGAKSGTATVRVSSYDGNAQTDLIVNAADHEHVISSITYSGELVHPVQYAGHVFDPDGLTFTGHYPNADTVEIPASEFKPCSMVFGEAVVLEHEETGIEVTITEFVVTENTLTVTITGDELTNPNFKTNASWNHDGLIASGKYADGGVCTEFEWSYSPETPELMGVGDDQDLTIKATANSGEYAEVVVSVNVSTFVNTYGISGDYFIKIGDDYADTTELNSKGAPLAVTTTTNKSIFSFELVGDDQFTIKQDTKFLWNIDDNNGVRFGGTPGSDASKQWNVSFDSEGEVYILRNQSTSRYLACFNHQDFRSYDYTTTAPCGITLEPAVIYDSLVVDATDAKTNYFVNDDLVTTGLVVRGVVGGTPSETTIPLNKLSFSVSKITTAGPLTVTVSYTNYDSSTAVGTYDITAAAEVVESLTLSGSYKTKFVKGDEFNYTGLVVKGIYNSGRDVTLESSEYEVTAPDMTSVGNKDVTITYLENTSITTSYSITVIEESNIRIKTQATHKVFDIDEVFSSTGLEVEVVYNDETARELLPSEYTIDPVDTSTGGTKVVHIHYGSFEATYEVFVRTQTGIKVDELPSKTTYQVGDKFKSAGIAVVNVYDNGDEVYTLDYEISMPDDYIFTEDDIGTKSISVNQDEFSTSFTITVTEHVVDPVLNSIEITHQPNKTQYIVGEDCTNYKEGLEVTAHFYDGDDQIVTSECEIGSFSTLEAGVRHISVTYTYKGVKKGTEFTLTVIEDPSAKVLESISIQTPASKTEFVVGETFSHDGIAVYAHYSNSDTANVTGSCVFSNPDMTTAGQKVVTISYTEGGVTKTVTYTITVKQSGGGEVTPTKNATLPVGAIVGIAVGGTIVVGLGAFALVWFVFKKKTWADLVAVFKKK